VRAWATGILERNEASDTLPMIAVARISKSWRQPGLASPFAAVFGALSHARAIGVSCPLFKQTEK